MKLFYILYFCCLLVSCKHDISPEEIDTYDDYILVSDHKDGFQYIYIEDEKVAEGHVYNSKKEGFWKFYKNNQIVSEGAYIKGIKHGFWKTYYSNNNVKSEGHYEKGTPKEYWKYYTKDGDGVAKRY